MNFNTKDRVVKMIKAIEQESKEKAQNIQDLAQQQFVIEKNNIVRLGKEKIDQEMKTKMEQTIIQQRIQKSSQINKFRLQKMEKRYEQCLLLQDELKLKLENYILNPTQYKQLLKQLTLETLLKLWDVNVILRCRKQDASLLEGILGEISKEFNELVLTKCNKKIDIKLSINKESWLDDTHKDCIGGVVGQTFRNRITVNNTLKDRISLVFQEYLPEIRSGLFPDYK